VVPPPGSDDVENWACPLLNVTGPADRSVPEQLPLRKSTVPSGVPTAAGIADTVAVKVTDWPVVDGLTLDET